jgi:hypothetical protein
MTEKVDKSIEILEDLTFGQSVIITARWILVLAGLLLVLWNPGPLSQLRVQIVFVLALAVANFYLHAQLLMGRPVTKLIVYGASAADLVVITVMILVGGGFDSTTFVFYFPAILAFSVAFPPRMTFFFTAAILAGYFLIFLVSSIISTADFQTLLARSIMLAAVAVCGSLYWKIERDRRMATEKARDELLAQVSQASR